MRLRKLRAAEEKKFLKKRPHLEGKKFYDMIFAALNTTRFIISITCIFIF